MKLSQEVLDQIRFGEQIGFSRIHLSPPDVSRQSFVMPTSPNPTPVGRVVDTQVTDGRIPVRIYIPEGEGPFPVVTYCHGGGFVLFGLDAFDEICRKLCARSQAVVMSVDYRLAPENPYPAGPLDCLNAARWMVENARQYNGIGERMAMVGDSAGGCLALWVAQRLSDEGIPLKAQVAAYPVTDHPSARHASYEENKAGYLLTAELITWFWDQYVADASQWNEASPLRTPDLSKLPPSFIFTAHFDPLRDEGKAYADRLKAAGVDTVYKNYNNIHAFLSNGGSMAEEALVDIAVFLKEKLNR